MIISTTPVPVNILPLKGNYFTQIYSDFSPLFIIVTLKMPVF